ncbi:MAG: energy transducer TonB [Acidobacteriota bacterium]|nr:energy transducer TonB [Acidobacteriota bacterium]MDQ3419701.1 energy transducer TonB [Acidobacteriota bacterium]
MTSSSAYSPEQTMSQETTTGTSPNARFLAGAVASSGVEVKRAGNATLASILVHVGFVLLALFAIANPPAALSPEPEERIPNEIVWLDVPGPGGGGGGGGNKMPDPPRKAELKGAEKVTVPVTKPAAPIAKADPPPPVPQIQIPAQQTATGVVELPGMVSNVPTPSVPSQGSGVGGGAGTGSGTGAGSGQGSGLGPGFGGGTGGGVYRPGNGVETPQVIHEEKPLYTAGAMRAKVQGIVEVEAVVMPDGTVGQVQVVRSLDDRFGLDEKAIEAVKRWRFRPGTRQGKPVPVLVNIELTFTLR